MDNSSANPGPPNRPPDTGHIWGQTVPKSGRKVPFPNGVFVALLVAPFLLHLGAWLSVPSLKRGGWATLVLLAAVVALPSTLACSYWLTRRFGGGVLRITFFWLVFPLGMVLLHIILFFVGCAVSLRF
jgi:hypothetical protein